MAAGNTYEAIATTTLGSAASNITFSSITGSYTDLVLVFNGGTDRGVVDSFQFQVNGDTGSNYSYTRIYGDGSAAYSDRNSNASFGQIGNLSTSVTTSAIVQFMNYSNSTTYKTVLTRNGLPANYVFSEVNLWRSTAAITSIKIYSGAGNILSGSTASLYGIKSF